MGATRLWLSLAGCLAGLSACSSDVESDAVTGTASAPIINGVNDTTHGAVVTVYDEQGKSAMLCSGTVIHVDAESHIGSVLTAGHCTVLPPKYVYVGDDFHARATLRYEVIDARKHPLYDGTVTSSYDFAIVRFAGAEASTPTMPILPPAQDKLAEKAVVTCVGFGRTSAPSESSDNTARQSIDRSLSAVSPTKLSYSISNGGICNGDSGGPALVAVGTTEYVAGVHSYVTGNCDGVGVSGRISAAFDWVQSIVTEPAPAASCDLCIKRVASGTGACRKMEQACLADAQCGNYARCLSACSNDSCRTACENKYPLGIGPYNTSKQCACNTEDCADVCAGSPSCAATPSCGYVGVSSVGGACATCTDSTCCNELAACAADGTCYDCLQKDDRPAACATNGQRVALAHCRERSCAPSCDMENAAWAATESGEMNPLSTFGPVSGGGCAMSPTPGSPAGPATMATTLGVVLGMILRRRRRSVR
ncbi:MYXO-CTERM sorting domain-containing protein [Pendulispora rubella]|uniref:MYXO-CTERM sorting domain-containing protein n=1 Tax=Pendulispora rubella TaxID=2741070 RepID=A0ABZ2L0G9_9BACT